MKVLIISHTYVVKVNQQKIQALAALPDLEVGLVVPEFWRDQLRNIELEKKEDPNYQVFPLKVYRAGDISRHFYNPLSLFKVLRKFGPQIVHVEEEPFSWALVEINLLTRLLGIKTVFFTWQNLMQPYSHPMRLIELVNFGLSDYAIAGNQDAREILVQRGFNKGVSVLCQLGVDPGTFFPGDEPGLRRQLGFQKDQVVIGFMGRFVEEKGILTLLAAFGQLVSDPKTGSARLLLLGGGDLLGIIHERVDRGGMANKVKIVPAVSHHEVPQYLRLMDMLVLPSESREYWVEQFGHVLIEAMVSGVVVVGSDSGAIPEVIGGAGLVFPEGNAAVLAEKLTTLLKDHNLRHKLAEQGYQRVMQHFLHNKVAERTREIYRRVL